MLEDNKINNNNISHKKIINYMKLQIIFKKIRTNDLYIIININIDN